MNAICTKPLKSGKIKRVKGRVLQRGLGVITLVVNKPDGSNSIVRIKESEYTVNFY